MIYATEQPVLKVVKVLKAVIKIGDMSYLMLRYAEDKGYRVVKEFVGHGIGSALHEPPEIPNYGFRGSGPVIPAGATLAIELMLN